MIEHRCRKSITPIFLTYWETWEGCGCSADPDKLPSALLLIVVFFAALHKLSACMDTACTCADDEDDNRVCVCEQTALVTQSFVSLCFAILPTHPLRAAAQRKYIT